ncbi:MAG: hypothetical protein LC749_19255, partial [Actinobacteria bacterium]|nr:hypothetical protein [Actinomycetota bacterium]
MFPVGGNCGLIQLVVEVPFALGHGHSLKTGEDGRDRRPRVAALVRGGERLAGGREPERLSFDDQQPGA